MYLQINNFILLSSLGFDSGLQFRVLNGQPLNLILQIVDDLLRLFQLLLQSHFLFGDGGGSVRGRRNIENVLVWEERNNKREWKALKIIIKRE